MSSKRDQRGFTLIEIVVMMAVVVIGVLATLSVANLAVRTSESNEQRVAAVNLAREGVELVRAIRDSNWAATAQESGSPCWDYYPISTAQRAAVPYTASCADQRWSAPAFTTPQHFVVHPNVGNGMPHLAPQSAATTSNSVYRLCRNAGTGLYTPSALVCTGAGAVNADTFYRRVTITRGKSLGNDPVDSQPRYNIRVQSFVTWSGHDGPDMMVETYLTDWRKF